MWVDPGLLPAVARAVSSRPAQGRSLRLPTAENVVAVIVTMQPENDVVAHVETLIGQGIRTIVVDNGSGLGASPVFDSIAELGSVQMIRNPVNMGVAHALNQGIQAATDMGASWLLTLDQDAAPSPEIARIAGDTFDAYPRPDLIAVIGSSSEADAARLKNSVGPGRTWIETRTAITAGSFVSLAAVSTIGAFRDDFFVDYVDIEFCLRARARGYRVLASLTPAMTHLVGEPTQRRIGPRSVRPTNHSATRRYYITRNRLIVWRRYARTDGHFVAGDILASQKELIKLMLFEADRPAKVRAMLAGLRDGIRNVTGEKGAPRG
jgi:rhamnosyltransferase